MKLPRGLMKHKIDPICGMQGSIKKHNNYFCSHVCVEKFEQKHKVKWYKEKIYIVSLIISLILVFSYFSPFLNPLFYAFVDYTKMIWWAILLGLFIGGLLINAYRSHFWCMKTDPHRFSPLIGFVDI